MTSRTVLIMAMCLAPAAASYSTARAQQAASSVLDGVYTPEQSKRGETQFATDCGPCHGEKLTGDAGPALVGKEFINAWKALTVRDLVEKVKNDMPANLPGSLTPQQASDLVAFVLSVNRFPAGKSDLPTDSAVLAGIRMTEPKPAEPQ